MSHAVGAAAASADLRVLVAEDHPLFRDALRQAIAGAFPRAELREAHSLGETVEMLSGDAGTDLLLLDLGLPDVRGFEGLLRIRGLFPRLPVLVISGHEEARVVSEAMSLGAAGFVPKSSRQPDLVEAIRHVLEGKAYLPEGFRSPEPAPADARRREMIARLATLTPQQSRVLHMLKEGLLNKQIAHELGVGETTVKAHVSEILRKLDVFSRTQAVIEMSRLDAADAFKGGLTDAR